MDGLRPRNREIFIGFTKAETEKMDRLTRELGEQVLEREFCQSTAKSFNRSAGRAGKPIVKWTEVQSWFENRVKESSNISRNLSEEQGHCPSNKARKSSQKPKAEEEIPDVSELEFEARSSKDGAWYDVEKFLAHRFPSTGETEVRVKFVGFGAEEDEWVNVKKAVRERSVPLEHSECHTLKERRDQAIYYDAHITDIQRKMHDVRGCRCLFSIRYNHDNSEERVRLRRLCRRPKH
ncbi:protein SAWADEE HOMEODOMAIN HOMOLOG 1-like isoform X4 [Pyrus communis]|uniref:protein SAWADEE HOMEODOMAIN HOMOLOG 1-like isoform X4 n=1 Tax=Pyrus communis TaxID=23211 RepID=UPI0035BF1DD9